MLSTGQLIFAVLFFIAFVFVIAFTYNKDKSWHRKNYKGVQWVLATFVIFIIILFLIKYFLKN